MNYWYFILSVLPLSFIHFYLYAQDTDSARGIELRVMDFNRAQFYYGEPFRIFTKITNTKDTINDIWSYQVGVNFIVLLKNLDSGKEIRKKEFGFVDGFANQSEVDWYKTTPPPDSRKYQANEFTMYFPHMGKNYGKIKLTPNPILGTSIVHTNLYALPVGNYEMTFEYYLYPFTEKLTVRHRFEILPLTYTQQLEFNAFVDAVHYANESYFWGTKDYDESHNLSLENFIKKYPRSIYTEPAKVILTTMVYLYPVPNEQRRRKMLQEALDNDQYIKSPANKAWLAWSAPIMSKVIHEYDPAKTIHHLDQVLQRWVKDDPYISDVLIIQANRKVQKVNSLKNYSLENRQKVNNH